MDNQRINNKIGFVGRITPVKGLDIILKSMSFISSKWKLEVFGEFDSDEYKKYVKELITELRLETRVTFHGWISCAWTFFRILISYVCHQYMKAFHLQHWKRYQTEYQLLLLQ